MFADLCLYLNTHVKCTYSVYSCVTRCYTGYLFTFREAVLARYESDQRICKYPTGLLDNFTWPAPGFVHYSASGPLPKLQFQCLLQGYHYQADRSFAGS